MTKLPAVSDQQVMEQPEDPAAEAWDYRRQGYDYASIAEQMGLTEKAVCDLVLQYVNRTMATDDDPETLRRLDIARCELALSHIVISAAQGDIEATKLMLTLMERREKLQDRAPVKAVDLFR